MGDMREEFRHYRETKKQILSTCQCGQPKAHPSHLACNGCMAKVPEEIRSEFYDKARNKRGAPSYYAARNRLIKALEALAAVSP